VMRGPIIAAIIIMLIGLLITCCSAQGERVKLILDLEPRGCGEVYAEPPGENYTYPPGTMVQVYARPAEGCRFAYWVSDLAGLNGSINNPVTVTLFSDASFKAVFARVGAPAPKPGAEERRTHAFLMITANATGFKEEVKLVPIGEEVMVSVPRDIYVNDSARYVFVGWQGLDAREPTIRILVMNDTTVTALYTLYLRFMDLWYHYSDFTEFHAPVVELGPGERLRPLHLVLKPMNATLPVGSKIPRELADRVEVKYQREYLLSIINTAPELLTVSISHEPYTLGSHIEKWVPEGLPVTVDILTGETERIWVTSPLHTSLIMDGPRSIVIEYEEKPHAWALDSPLKPLIYPILDSIARSYRGTGAWPQVSRIISQPAIVYAVFAAIPAMIAGAGYMGYRMLPRIIRPGAPGRGRKVLEERIRRARPEEILSAIPSTAAITPAAAREERLPDNVPFPDWLCIEAPEQEAEPEPAPAAPIEAEAEEPARRIVTDPMEVISRGGEVMADDLIEALAGGLDEKVLDALRSAILSGRLKVVVAAKDLWSPFPVRAVARVLERNGAAAIIGADMFVRRRVAEWLGAVEEAVTGKPYIIIEDAYESTPEAAAARIGDSSLVILGETTGPAAVRAYSIAARLLGRRLIKLGEGPLPPARVQEPSLGELAAYMAVRAAAMGLIDRVGLREVMEVARIASMSRSYTTIDDYLRILASRPVGIEEFRRIESGKLFDRFEQEAVAAWRRTGSINDAIIHYSNILAQMDPANMAVKLRIFREKLAKMARAPQPPQQPPPPPREEPAPEPAKPAGELDEIARRYEVMLRGVGSEDVRRRIMRHLEELRGGRREPR